ncbi:uncharacterized protein LOC120843705 [Ixodes scapularis]|uniref:uncharacterized protein LOC120843705 n=1 Tax=Ixodes scapularis TaxID=6945 RepID=UPI001A9E2FB0|nr:uncharacterized protein LOC120843705 [Ixodes scapularis]
MSAPVVIRTWFLCCHIIFGGGAVVTSQHLRSPSSHSRWCCHGLWLVGVPSLLTKPLLPVVPVEMVAGTWRGFAATAGSSVTFLWLFGCFPIIARELQAYHGRHSALLAPSRSAAMWGSKSRTASLDFCPGGAMLFS